MANQGEPLPPDLIAALAPERWQGCTLGYGGKCPTEPAVVSEVDLAQAHDASAALQSFLSTQNRGVSIERARRRHGSLDPDAYEPGTILEIGVTAMIAFNPTPVNREAFSGLKLRRTRETQGLEMWHLGDARYDRLRLSVLGITALQGEPNIFAVLPVGKPPEIKICNSTVVMTAPEVRDIFAPWAFPLPTKIGQVRHTAADSETPEMLSVVHEVSVLQPRNRTGRTRPMRAGKWFWVPDFLGGAQLGGSPA
jgi:hypothetical protein